MSQSQTALHTRTRKNLSCLVKLMILLVLSLGLLGCPPPAAGPDGKPLPGDKGGAPIPNPRNLQEPPLVQGVLPIEDAVRKDMKDHPNDKEREFEPTVVIEADTENPDPPPPTIRKKFTVKIKVKWSRLDNGRYRFTYGNPVTTVEATPTPDGKAELKILINPPKTGEHYGPSVFFVAAASGCTDAIWVQYVKREFKFVNASGEDKGSSTKGPEIDQQIPYQNQGQITAGAPAMEDSPGINDKLGTSPQDSAKGALDKFKKDAGVTDSSITKATVRWSFWSYLLCLDPKYEVVGHYEWGFTLIVDTENKPYITQSETRDPVWTAGK